jgi:hypothetical protein
MSDENPLAKYSDDAIVKEVRRQKDLKAVADDAYNRQDAKFKNAIGRLENELLRRMLERGNKGFRTEYGTVYKEEVFKPSCADWQVVYDWVLEDPDRFSIFEKRLTKKFVVDYMEHSATTNELTGERELGPPPPGVNVLREFVARVRKN